MYQHFLYDNARIKQIDAQSLLSMTVVRDCYPSGSITTKHIPTPFSGEVTGMDGKSLRVVLSDLHSIAGITALINM